MSATSQLENTHLESAMDAFKDVAGRLMVSYCRQRDDVSALSRELEEARREARVQVREKERLAQRLGLLLDALPAGVVVLDGKGVVRESNPAARRLLGTPLHGSLWRDVVERVFAPRPDDGQDVSLKSGRVVNLSTCSLGREPGQILLIKDVTENHRLEARLNQLRRLSAMGEMAASLAHQIRTPLASALLYVGTLGRGTLDDDTRNRAARRVRDVLGHMEQLVRDMLAFAHTGRFQLQALPVSLVFDTLVKRVQLELESHGAEFSAGNHADQYWIQGNLDALASAFQNLVDNALQACGEGARLELSVAACADDRVSVSLRDNGPGLPGDLGERVLEPFVTSRGNGTGLGLAVVRSVTEAHGGNLRLESSPGQGACVSMELPAARGAAPVSDGAPGTSRPDHTGGQSS